MSGGRDRKGARPVRAPRPQKRDMRSGDYGRARPEGDRQSDRDGDDYEVGFGKPPRATRFPKGQSGNPRGRPKKPKPKPIQLSDAPTDVFLQEEAYRLLKFRENGQEVELPTAQLLRRAQHNLGLKGNRIALKNALDDIEAKEKEHQQRRIDRYVRLSALKREGEAQIAEHRRRGLPAPDLLPHPDDIVLNHQTAEVWINGPETREDLRHYEHLAELRDLCVMQSALNWQRQRRNRTKAETGTYCSAIVFAGLIDHLLPQRFRLSEAEELDLFLEFEREDRRKLEARFNREAARLERERPPSMLSDEQRYLLERTMQRIRAQLWPEAEDG